MKRITCLAAAAALVAACESPTEAPRPASPDVSASSHAPPAHAANSVKLDLFRDCDFGGCDAENPLDMQGPDDQGWLIYRQDQETGDLRLLLNIHKEGAPGETYEVFLTCGPGGIGTPHAESCGFMSVGTATANGAGNATESFTVPKCVADDLISGNPFDSGQQAHADVLKGVSDQSAGLFVATAIDFDPDIGPACGPRISGLADTGPSDPVR